MAAVLSLLAVLDLGLVALAVVARRAEDPAPFLVLGLSAAAGGLLLAAGVAAVLSGSAGATRFGALRAVALLRLAVVLAVGLAMTVRTGDHALVLLLVVPLAALAELYALHIAADVAQRTAAT